MTSSQNNIVVPIDYSELSLIALRQSFKFARISSAKIILVHIVSKDNTSKEEEDKISNLAKKTEIESGLKIDYLFLKGNVYEKINETAELVSAKMIFMGLNSSPRGIKNVLGQNAFKIIKNAKCPVVTIKEKLKHDSCKNIVLPLDLSKESREKVGKAVEFAKYFKAAIRIVSVFSHSELWLENKLLSYTHQVKNFIKESGVACSNKTIEGSDKAKIIIDYADKIEADLIIITTQMEVGLSELFKGTASQQIVNNSTIPVMSLRPIQRKDTTSFTSPY